MGRFQLVVRTRLDAYHRQTAPILPYYERRGILHVVDGTLPIAEVTRRIKEVVAQAAAAH